MRKVVATLASAALLSGCVTYKVEATEDYRPVAVESADAEVLITRINEYPEGLHCFEPMLHVLSIGIIPAHCVERYNVSVPDSAEQNVPDDVTHFTVTSVAGWIALPMALSREWRYGYPEAAPGRIEELVRQNPD